MIVATFIAVLVVILLLMGVLSALWDITRILKFMLLGVDRDQS